MTVEAAEEVGPVMLRHRIFDGLMVMVVLVVVVIVAVKFVEKKVEWEAMGYKAVDKSYNRFAQMTESRRFAF